MHGAKKMLKQQKVQLPKTTESLNQKVTMGFSWQEDPQRNNGEIVLTLRMEMEIPHLLAQCKGSSAPDSIAIFINAAPVEPKAELQTTPSSAVNFSLFLFTKIPIAHRTTPADNQGLRGNLSLVIKSRKAWIFIKVYHMSGIGLDALKISKTT